ncbi:hypothetical protein BAE44_0021555, partial [Dichanthelium oligosanthes]
LTWKLDGSRLQQIFNQHGHVDDGMMQGSSRDYDRDTEHTHGFGIVTVATMKEATVAVASVILRLQLGKSCELCHGSYIMMTITV